jgi:N-acetylmuramoyl-L-alanine amidase
MQALRIIGYDIKDSTAAIGAFKRKFLQLDKSTILTEEDKRVLYSIMKKSL